jgi:hypothetical protein
MKTLSSVVLAGLLSVSVAACAKEEPKTEATLPVVTVVAQAEVKKEEAAPAAPAEPVYRTVCLDVQGRDGKPVIDPKTNKPRQNCTKVRVRQKFEGTAIDTAPKN